MNLSDSIFPAVSSQMRALLSLLELEYLVGRESPSCKNLSNSDGPRMDLWVQEL